TRFLFSQKQPRGNSQADDQRKTYGTAGAKSELVPANQFLETVDSTGWTRDYRFVQQVALHIRPQSIGRLVTPSPVLLQRFHHDPIQVSAKKRDEPWSVALALLGDQQEFAFQHRAH